MSIVIVRYLCNVTYTHDVFLCSSMDVAVDSIRQTMCAHGDHSTLIVKKSHGRSSADEYVVFREGQEQEHQNYIAEIEDCSEQRIRTEPSILVEVPVFPDMPYEVAIAYVRKTLALLEQAPNDESLTEPLDTTRRLLHRVERCDYTDEDMKAYKRQVRAWKKLPAMTGK
jgi:hypothetical protein